jgi:hypothetical protein
LPAPRSVLRVFLKSHPIPSSSIRSSGAPQIRQMIAEQSPHTNGSVTAV